MENINQASLENVSQEYSQNESSILKCSYCASPNRLVAKFCRFCGNSILQTGITGTKDFSELQYIDDFVGLESIKTKIQNYIDKLVIEKEQKKQGLVFEQHTTIFVFRGETGTGKSTVAEYFISKLQNTKCFESSRVEIVKAKSLKRSYADEFALSQYLSANKLGILLVDEIQEDENYLHELLLGLTNKVLDTICILLGTKEPLDEFFSKYPEDVQRVTDFYEFPKISDKNLISILQKKISKIGFVLDGDVNNYFEECIQEAKTDVKCVYKNGWIVEKEILEKIKSNQRTRLKKNFPILKPEDYKRILIEDLPISSKALTSEEVLIQLDELIGMENVKRAVKELAQTIAINKQREKQGISEGPLPSIHIIFTGNPGTGKTTVARLLGKLFHAMKLLPSDKVIEVDKSGIVSQYVGATPKLVNEVVDSALGGVLFIDEAYTLAGDGHNIEYGKEAIDTLLKRMEDDRGKFVVIAAGYEKEMQNFISANPGLKSRFTHFIHLEDYNADELFELFKLYAKKDNYIISHQVGEILYSLIEEIWNNRGKDFANGRTIRNLFDDTVRRMSSRVSELPVEQQTKEVLTTFMLEDIPQPENKRLSTEEVLSQLDELIGMVEVKRNIRELCQTIQMNRKRESMGIKTKKPEIHIVFTGNPGTGKTTVARLLGKLFYSMGLLPSDRVIEVDKSGIVSQYVGATPKLVNEVVDSALGGVLFIDEAYTLAGDGHNIEYGKEAIDTLLKRMEDDRGKFVVIAAGYEKEMQNFISANPGLKSRFTHFIHLEDYNPEELVQLYQLYSKENNYTIDTTALSVIKSAVTEIYNSRDKDFANGRTIRNLFDDTVRRMSSRVSELPVEQQTKESLTTITVQDIPFEQKQKEISKEDILKELNEMIGLEGVKKAVHELMDSIEMAKERAEITGDKAKNPVKHIVFTGNPGTGKTTVARIFGKLFKAIGLLPTSEVHEVARGEMVGQYVGQTAPLVNSVCDKAIGGTLFIDEAYMLNQGKSDSYGHEAIDTLLKRMEDDRGKYVVIAAGYKQNMEDFIQSNPGLKSRFTTFIHLDDYNSEELQSLFELYSNKEKFTIEETAKIKLKECISYIYENRGADFANGRTIRNLFDKVKEKQSTRIAKLAKEKRSKVLCLLCSEDIENAFNEIQEELE